MMVFYTHLKMIFIHYFEHARSSLLCMGFPPSCSEWGLLLLTMARSLNVVSYSFLYKHRLQNKGSSGSDMGLSTPWHVEPSGPGSNPCALDCEQVLSHCATREVLCPHCNVVCKRDLLL